MTGPRVDTRIDSHRSTRIGTCLPQHHITKRNTQLMSGRPVSTRATARLIGLEPWAAHLGPVADGQSAGLLQLVHDVQNQLPAPLPRETTRDVE